MEVEGLLTMFIMRSAEVRTPLNDFNCNTKYMNKFKCIFYFFTFTVDSNGR